MKSAPRKAMVYRKGLINGAAKEYPEVEMKDIRKKEIKELIATGIAGIALVIAAILLLNMGFS